MDLYYSVKFNDLSQGNKTVNLLQARTSVGTPILTVRVNPVGKLVYWNNVAQTYVGSNAVVPRGSWQTVHALDERRRSRRASRA